MANEFLKDLAKSDAKIDRIEDQYLSQIFAKQKEAEAYAAKRDGNKKSHRRLW